MYFGLEKAHNVRKYISQIRTKKGRITKDPEKVAEEFKMFYADLYSQRPIDKEALDKLLEKLELNTNKMKSKKMAKLVSRSEIRRAIRKTKRGSSPGPDGFPRL